MALVVADRIKETTTTTGTGTYTLAGAEDGFQSFAAVGNGNTTYYACTDGTDFEVGLGTFTLSGTTLARTNIIESSNSDAAVNWGAGTKEIFVTLPASKAIFEDTFNSVSFSNDISVTNKATAGRFDLDGAKDGQWVSSAYGIVFGTDNGGTSYLSFESNVIVPTTISGSYRQGNVQLGHSSSRFSTVYSYDGDFVGTIKAASIDDYSNTSYYLDPAATSTSLNVAGKIAVAGDVDCASDLELAGKIIFDDLGGLNTQYANIFFGTAPQQGNPSTHSDVTGYGADGYGMILEAGSSGDVGFIKITDDGVILGGAADENLFTCWDEDVQLARLTVDGSGHTTAHMSLRTPIMYDSDNTSFYFDGASASTSISVLGSISSNVSDERLKDIEGNIDSPIEKISQLSGFYYRTNKTAAQFGYKPDRQVGVSAQQVEAVMPEVVQDAAVGHGYKTVDYARLVPLLIEAIKEQQAQIQSLTSRLDGLEN